MSRKYFDELERHRVLDRKIDEFMGIARALANKETLEDSDIKLLDSWMSANDQIVDEPLVSEIFDLVDDLVGQPVTQTTSRNDVLHAIKALVGTIRPDGTVEPTSLPINNPTPDIAFKGKRFCFTGTFAFGTRSDCESEVVSMGGTIGAISASIDFLVVGSNATDSWKHPAFGTKIMKAVKWRDVDGYDIAIIDESQWTAALARVRAEAAAQQIAKSSVPDWRMVDGILTLPTPEIVFTGKKFCFTGAIQCGTRTDCEETIVLRGGEFSDSVTVDTDFLVVGMERGDWSEPIGSKIRRTMDLNARGERQIAIVREEDWLSAMIVAPHAAVQGRLSANKTAIELQAAAGCELHPEAKLRRFAESADLRQVA